MELPRQLGARQEAGPRGEQVSRPGLGLAERHEQLAACGRVLGPVQRLQRHPVEASRLLVGEQCARRDRPPAARTRPRGPRSPPAPPRRSDGRSQRGAARRSCACTPTSASPIVPVEPNAPRRLQRVVERVADERVREAQPIACAGHARRAHPPQGPRPAARAEPRRSSPPTRSSVTRLNSRPRPTRRRAGAGSRRRAGGADGRSHPGRPAGSGSRSGVPPFEQCSRAEHARHLAEEERVALGAPVERGHQAVGGCDAGVQLDEAADGRLGKALQREASRVMFAGELEDGGGQRMIAPDLGLAVGADDHEARPLELAADELEQQQRGGVGGVQVVEHEEERPGTRGVPQERGHRVEQAEARSVGAQCGWLRNLGEALAHLRHHLSEVGRSGPELEPERLGLARVHVGTQGLDPRPVGRCSACLPAAAEQHPHAELFGSCRELVRQPALPDPGLPADQHQPAMACARIRESGEQLVQLALAADEGAALAARRRSRRSPVHTSIRRIEGDVLREDALLEVSQLAARFDAELVDERPASLVVDLERLRVAPTAVEREHELPARALAQRLRRGQDLELGHQLGVASERRGRPRSGPRERRPAAPRAVRSPPARTPRTRSRRAQAPARGRARRAAPGRRSPRHPRRALRGPPHCGLRNAGGRAAPARSRRRIPARASRSLLRRRSSARAACAAGRREPTGPSAPPREGSLPRGGRSGGRWRPPRRRAAAGSRAARAAAGRAAGRGAPGRGPRAVRGCGSPIGLASARTYHAPTHGCSGSHGPRRGSLPPRCRRVAGPLDTRRMTSSRETFVVQVHEDGGAVLESVRTGECVWLGQLSEVAVQITGWLEQPERGADGAASRCQPTGGSSDVR